jgi:hypothetical protein
MDICLILNSIVRIARYTTIGFVLRDRLLMSLKLTIIRS